MSEKQLIKMVAMVIQMLLWQLDGKQSKVKM